MWSKGPRRLPLAVLKRTCGSAWASLQSSCSSGSLKPWCQLIPGCLTTYHPCQKGTPWAVYSFHIFMPRIFWVSSPLASLLLFNSLAHFIFPRNSTSDEEKLHHLNQLHSGLIKTSWNWFKPGFLPSIQFPLAISTKLIIPPYQHCVGACVWVIWRGRESPVLVPKHCSSIIV